MSLLKQVTIVGVRTIERADLEFSSRFNLIFGDNGSGKTSLLESISLLSYGRSFRTTKTKTLIKENESQLLVRGIGFTNGDCDDQVTFATAKYRDGHSEYRFNRESVNSISSAAASLPLLVIDDTCFRSVVQSPQHRRKTLDWLLFHVKHGFLSLWQQNSKLLKQRNALLRQGKGRCNYDVVAPWDVEIAVSGSQLTLLRHFVYTKLSDALLRFIGELNIIEFEQVKLEFISGWGREVDNLLDGVEPNKVDLNDTSSSTTVELEAISSNTLRDTFPKDSTSGFTTKGSHRADIKVTIAGTPVHDVLSRGQIKTLSVLFNFAAAETLMSLSADLLEKRVEPLVLIDDLSAELDKSNIARVVEWLNKVKLQAFIAAVDRSDFDVFTDHNGLEKTDISMFHVKHGVFETVYKQEQRDAHEH